MPPFQNKPKSSENQLQGAPGDPFLCFFVINGWFQEILIMKKSNYGIGKVYQLQSKQRERAVEMNNINHWNNNWNILGSPARIHTVLPTWQFPKQMWMEENIAAST